jgi:peptidyl-prolyl cis-trans isomerase D
MLSFFRTMAKSKLVWIVLFVPMTAGLLTIGGVRQNLGDLFTPKDAVIQAGSRVYGTADFKREFENYRRRASQDGQQFTADDAVAQGLDQRMLQVFSERESMFGFLQRMGVWPSDRQVVNEIAKEKAFLDPISGKFDQKTYVQLLAQNDTTPAQFEKSERDTLAYTQFAAAVASGLKPPRLYGTMFGAYLYQTRDLSLFPITAKALGPPATPTEADLQKLLKDHADQLTVPETRQFSVVKFSAAALAPTVTADPAEVKKRFDFRKDTLSQPEKRSLIQISAKDAAQALDISTKLKAGADPAAAAKAAGLQPPLVYTDVAKNGVADSKVGEAAFLLPAGGVSNPIQGNLGWAVVKVAQITPGKIVTFEDAKASIEAEVKSEAAANKAYELVQKYEAAHDKGASLSEAAKVVGVTPETLAPATAGGTDADGKPIPGLTPRMLKEAAALSQGGETDAVQESKGEYFALRVEKVIPPMLPSIDKLRPQLVQAFQQQDLQKRLTAKLAELQESVKKGQSFEAAAQSIGSQVVHLKINISQAQQTRNLPPALLSQIFGGKPGDLIVTGAGGLARIDAIEPVPPGVIATVLPAGQQALGRGVFDELQQEARAWTKDQVKPKINVALARQAIGASDKAAPAGAATAPAAPAGKAQ